MMSIIGKWKVARAISLGETGFCWLKPDEYRAAHSDAPEDAEQMLATVIEFTEDGKVLYCVPLPAGVSQEQIDAAVEAGEILVKDGYLYEEKPWKEENGNYFYDSGIQGEVFGEAVSSWVELPIADDGTMDFMHMLRLEKI